MQPTRVYGVAVKPPEPVLLCAGPLKLLFDNGEIRYLRIGDVEVLRRVYVAVRDRNWCTIPPVVSGLQMCREADSFEISYHAEHSGGGLQFAWDGRITGSASGEVRFEMRGRAGTAFLTNRTGICVLHPSTCAGAACVIEHPDGSHTAGNFPRQLSPHQPFKNIRAIRHNVADATFRVLMEGDTFEMEDQRNWSDGSYKTYCRPLELPYPYELLKGQSLDQTITIQTGGDAHSVPATIDRKAPLKLDLAAKLPGEWVPQVGLTVADGFDGLDPKSIAELKSLRLRSLRLDLDLASGWREKLAAYCHNLKSIGVPLEVALTCPDKPYRVLRELAAAWPQYALPVARWLILPPKGVTSAAQIGPAREALANIELQAIFGGGTDVEFVAVNRQHPPMEDLDALTFALNPQVHATDSLSIIENLQAHTDLLASAIQLSCNRLVCVSPITLKRRSNPDATAPDTLASAGILPASVDPRQMSLFAAAWTVASLSRLCHAHYLTYFETHGWRGVLQGNSPPPLPALFPAAPGDLFPVYHVLKSFLNFGPERWSAPAIDRPLELAAIHLRRPDRHRLLLANLTPNHLKLALSLPKKATLTILDATTVDAAFRDAEFWVNASSSRLGATSEVELGDYAIAAVDWSLK